MDRNILDTRAQLVTTELVVRETGQGSCGEEALGNTE